MMHPSKSFKALLLIANHISAISIPPANLSANLDGDERTFYDSGLVSRGAGAFAKIDIWGYRDACSCKPCPRNQIQDPSDCKKCKKCGPGKKPDVQQKKCIKSANGEKCPKCPKGHVRDPKDCTKCVKLDKKKQMEKRKENLSEKWRAVVRKHKAENWEKVSKVNERRFKDKQDNRKRAKVRRMSRCLGLVPLSMGQDACEEMDGLFDEEWTESMDMMAFWPSDIDNDEVDKWKEDKDDALYEDEKYINKWIDIGLQKRSLELTKRSEYTNETTIAELDDMANGFRLVKHDNIPSQFIREISVSSTPKATTTALMVRDPKLETRFFFLIPIFAAVLRTVVRVAVQATAAGLRVGGRVLKEGIRVSKGRNSRSRPDQAKGAQKVGRDNNWKRCLNGLDPQK